MDDSRRSRPSEVAGLPLPHKAMRPTVGLSCSGVPSGGGEALFLTHSSTTLYGALCGVDLFLTESGTTDFEWWSFHAAVRVPPQRWRNVFRQPKRCTVRQLRNLRPKYPSPRPQAKSERNRKNRNKHDGLPRASLHHRSLDRPIGLPERVCASHVPAWAAFAVVAALPVVASS